MKKIIIFLLLLFINRALFSASAADEPLFDLKDLMLRAAIDELVEDCKEKVPAPFSTGSGVAGIAALSIIGGPFGRGGIVGMLGSPAAVDAGLQASPPECFINKKNLMWQIRNSDRYAAVTTYEEVRELVNTIAPKKKQGDRMVLCWEAFFDERAYEKCASSQEKAYIESVFLCTEDTFKKMLQHSVDRFYHTSSPDKRCDYGLKFLDSYRGLSGNKAQNVIFRLLTIERSRIISSCGAKISELFPFLSKDQHHEVLCQLFSCSLDHISLSTSDKFSWTTSDEAIAARLPTFAALNEELRLKKVREEEALAAKVAAQEAERALHEATRQELARTKEEAQATAARERDALQQKSDVQKSLTEEQQARHAQELAATQAAAAAKALGKKVAEREHELVKAHEEAEAAQQRLRVEEAAREELRKALEKHTQEAAEAQAANHGDKEALERECAQAQRDLSAATVAVAQAQEEYEAHKKVCEEQEKKLNEEIKSYKKIVDDLLEPLAEVRSVEVQTPSAEEWAGLNPPPQQAKKPTFTWEVAHWKLPGHEVWLPWVFFISLYEGKMFGFSELIDNLAHHAHLPQLKAFLHNKVLPRFCVETQAGRVAAIVACMAVSLKIIHLTAKKVTGRPYSLFRLDGTVLSPDFNTLMHAGGLSYFLGIGFKYLFTPEDELQDA